MLRRALLGVSRSRKIKSLLTTAPIAAGVVERFIAGETSDDVVAVTRRLVGAGLLVSIDYLGEDTTDPAHADAVVVAYLICSPSCGNLASAPRPRFRSS